MRSPILTAVCPPVVTLSARDADALLQSGDGDAALLYIYLLRSGGNASAADAASALHRSERDIGTAADALRRMGLLRDSGGQKAETRPAVKPEPADELPEYTAKDILKSADQGFETLMKEAQAQLGRMLNTVEIKKLFGLYSDLGLPADVILLIIQRCIDEGRSRSGASRSGPAHVGFTAIEKEAYYWYNHGNVRTYEQAEQWLAELDRRRDMTERIKTALNISGRPLTPTERGYITGWIELGYDAEALAIAADRTITNTGKLTWKYMDSIVRSWNEKKLHTAAEIESGDSRPSSSRRGAKNTAPAQPDGMTREENDRALAQMAVLMKEMQADKPPQ